jgi:hypothetical protein
MLLAKPPFDLAHGGQAVPSILLIVLVEITIAAAAWQVLMRRRRANHIRALAQEWGMPFSTTDYFGVAQQAAKHLPMPGAATLRAVDLIYQRHRDDFFCAFTVSYTRGALGTKHRNQQVAGVRQILNEYSWIVAPAERNLIEQYEFVRRRLMKTKEPDKDLTLPGPGREG